MLVHEQGSAKRLFFSFVWLLQKELRLEWRDKARLNATFFLGVTTLFLFSLAIGPKQVLLPRYVASFFYLALFLSSTLALSESMQKEKDNEAYLGMLLLPVHPAVFFLAKACTNAFAILVQGLVLLPLLFFLWNPPLTLGLPLLLGVLFFFTGAISAPGTLYAALAVQAKARVVLLPLLLFPVLIPSLLSAVCATELIFAGDALGQLNHWLLLLVLFDLVFWPLTAYLFDKVL